MHNKDSKRDIEMMESHNKVNKQALNVAWMLRNALMDAGALADDAELKQLDNYDVKEWLNCLRDALYTADDLLDRICNSKIGRW
ncbi:hypothetical protein Ahy_B02g058240 [Arachis hypogaea]|uniref:Disease resistance N-terminal domain-containing protein n=1 Tax=Arachis hypogaea TaxID=3818 RepID=A0A445AE80_ARAHY|nr:hypothetical protein Ahy_B02g058240 [Arachis hypogaea]